MSDIKMDITDKVTKIYHKIAKWHNGDQEEPTRQNLIILSQEIVEEIINFTLSEMEIKSSRTAIEIDKDAYKKVVEEKMNEINDSKTKKEGEQINKTQEKKKLFGLF